jgi:hypothetical protein
MMRTFPVVTTGVLAVVLSVFLGFGALNALADQQGEHKDHNMGGEPMKVTLVGEVLDLYCYMNHPAEGQGADHAKCAKNCIRKGLPIGFLADGKVYLIIGKEHESAADLVVDFAGGQARLTGILIEHDGVKAIEIATIEKVVSTSDE